MTAQKNQIQALIAEIDGVLGKASPNLPWVMSRDAAEQRQLLGRIRGYLLSLQKAGMEQATLQARNSQQLMGYDDAPSANAYQPTPSPPGSVQQEAAQQILQTVVQEMGYLRASLTQPLQAELEALRQQREALVQELRQLEAQRQQYGLLQQQASQQQMLNEFLQVLMGRLQENLSQQIVQTLTATTAQALPYGSAYGVNSWPEGAYSAALSAEFAAEQLPQNSIPLLSPAQRLDRLQSLQAQSDQLLMSLDSSLSVVFEALQRNVQSYQDSLSQGIEKMHGLGYQGEVMFTALVNHLAQQLGREASSFLQSAAQPASLNSTPATTLPPIAPLIENPGKLASMNSLLATPGTAVSPDQVAFKLPYPGSELPLSTPALEVKQKSGPGIDSTSLKDLDLEDLDLSDLNLNEPDLSILDSPNLDTLLDLELSTAAPSDSNADTESQGVATTDTSLITSLELSDLPLIDHPEEIANLESGLQPETAEPEDFQALDSTLEFLEQLSAAMESSAQVAGAGNTVESLDEQSLDEVTAPPAVDERIYEELDEFYATLFGAEESTALEHSETAQPSPISVESTDLPIAVTSPPDIIPFSQPEKLSEPSIAFEPNLLESSLADFFFDTDSVYPPESLAPAATSPATASSPSDGFEELPLEFSSLFAESEQALPSSAEPDRGETLELLSSLLSDEPALTQKSIPAKSEAAAFPSLMVDATPVPIEESLPLGFVEDSYIPAAPEENLLATDPVSEESGLDLSLNASTLQQLSQDLSNLEGMENLDFQELQMAFSSPPEAVAPTSSQPSPVPEQPEIADWGSLTLNDFAETLPSTGASSLEANNAPTTRPEIFAAPADSNPLTLEHIDDLFGDLPAVPATQPGNILGTNYSPGETGAQRPNPSNEPPLTLNDVFADFDLFSPESEGEQKKKAP